MPDELGPATTARPNLAWLRTGAIAIGLLLLAWAIGLVWYIRLVETELPPPPVADGIVVLTGGADRVETGLRLLASGRGDRLLLSGIGGGAELAELAARAGVNPAPIAARITLGRRALSTHGNAGEAAAWVRREKIHSLLVVTAAYHMPRARIELGRALPDVTLYSVPVAPPGYGGWRRLSLLATEFNKFLTARLGLSGLFPERRPSERPSLERQSLERQSLERGNIHP